jgi:hypothetical protein
MDVNSLDFISITPSLKNHLVEQKIIEIVVEKVKAIPQFEKLKMNVDLVLYVCNIIENICFSNNINSKYKPKGYKLQIAQTVFERLSWTKPEDKDFLLNTITFLHNSKKIKTISMIKRILAFGKRFLISNPK